MITNCTRSAEKKDPASAGSLLRDAETETWVLVRDDQKSHQGSLRLLEFGGETHYKLTKPFVHRPRGQERIRSGGLVCSLMTERGVHAREIAA